MATTWPQPPDFNPFGGVAGQNGLLLSSAAEPLPNKLVEKIRSGQFVEMKELLTDNVSLINQLEAFLGYS